MGKLPLDEQPIHAIVVQAMTEGCQFVIMDDANQRMQYWCIHETSIVVGGFNLQNIPHIGGNDSYYIDCLLQSFQESGCV